MSWEYKETVLDKDPVIMAHQLRDLDALGWKWVTDIGPESIFRRKLEDN